MGEKTDDIGFLSFTAFKGAYGELTPHHLPRDDREIICYSVSAEINHKKREIKSQKIYQKRQNIHEKIAMMPSL